MKREEALQLLEQLRQLPDDVPAIDESEVAEWIVALNDPDDRLIERKLFSLRLKRTNSRIARLMAGLETGTLSAHQEATVNDGSPEGGQNAIQEPS